MPATLVIRDKGRTSLIKSFGVDSALLTAINDRLNTEGYASINLTDAKKAFPTLFCMQTVDTRIIKNVVKRYIAIG